MKRLMLAMLVAVPLAASANSAFKDCSLKANKMTKKEDLATMAKISPADAKDIALKETNGASIVKGGIETEDGCLIYSYHVKDASAKGQTEVLVDAGNGAVLKREHEGSFRTAMEKPVDKTKELAHKAKDKIDPDTK